MRCDPVAEVVGNLSAGLDGLASLDLGALTAKESMALARTVEWLGRRMDAQLTRVAGHLDDTGSYGVDGHKTTKAALVHVGRLSGSEAFGRVRTARIGKLLPAVGEAYLRGDIPTEAMRAIANFAANPRVQPFLDEFMDKLLAEQATTDHHSGLTGWLEDLKAAADPDGTTKDNDDDHTGRHATFAQHELTGAGDLHATCGAAQSEVIAEVLAAFEAAEWEADRQAAIAIHGPHPSVDQFPRTPGQRRMDAIVAVFRLAAATPPGAQAPAPLINVIIDAETLEDELARITSDTPAEPDDRRLDELAEGRICQTLSGRRLHPSDVIAALLVGHVRRVVVDSASNVIDLGRKRRLFTGSSRDAVHIQATLRRGVARCLWAHCQSPPHRQQCDHTNPHGKGGRTDVDNGELACGFHNRLKETGFRPVRRPDGGYDLHRPDGTKITPPT